MTIKNLLIGLAVVVAGGLIAGAYYFPKTQFLAGSPAGTSFNTAKVAGQAITTATTTTYAVLNSDASDREITGFDTNLANATATSTTYSLKCATSTSASSLQSNTNYILNTTLATSTFGTIINAGTFVASSSPGLTGTTTASTLVADLTNQYVRVWKTGSYLVCQVTTGDNYNAFNTTTTGTINFPYRGQ